MARMVVRLRSLVPLAVLVAALGELFGKLLGGGARKSGGEGETTPPRAGQERRGPLFGFYTEVRSLRTVPADPARFEVPAGFTRR